MRFSLNAIKHNSDFGPVDCGVYCVAGDFLLLLLLRSDISISHLYWLYQSL
jgi:hypothetical protein